MANLPPPEIPTVSRFFGWAGVLLLLGGAWAIRPAWAVILLGIFCLITASETRPKEGQKGSGLDVFLPEAWRHRN